MSGTNYKNKNIGLLNITHAEILASMSGNALTGGQLYRITDHETKHNQPITDIVKTRPIEALIVTALNASEIDKVVKSEIYPQDIIYYDVNDILCEDGITARKGRIYYRKDTITGNSTGYDWRNVFFARGKCNHALYNAGTTYAERDMVRLAGDGIYISVENANIGNAPASSPNQWWKILDLSVNEYWGWDATCNGISFNMSDTIEVPTFWILGEETNTSGIVNGLGILGGTIGGGFKNITFKTNKITKIDLSYWGYGALLSTAYYKNNIILLIPDGDIETKTGYITISDTNNSEEIIFSCNNTIKYGTSTHEIQIKLLHNCIGNIHIDNCNIEQLMNVVSYNTCFSNFNTNTISNSFLSQCTFTCNNINIITSCVCKNTIEKNNLIEIKNSIIDAIKYVLGNNLISNNYKNSTYLTDNYTKNLFIDSIGTQKISYIDATNTIQYALPTD